MNTLEPFALLADPARYLACDWNLAIDAEGRRRWVEFFKTHFRTMLRLGVAAEVARGADPTDAESRAQQCAAEFDAVFDAFLNEPHRYERVTILTLDAWRDVALRRHNFDDPFIDVKARENDAALPLLPRVCAQIDATRNPRGQFEALIHGIFAGNIFDLGADATARKFLKETPDFFQIRQQLSPRPWLIDDYDFLAQRMLDQPPHRKVVFFIDNAGSDFILGVIPFVRWLASRGTHVILAANERPSLNDLTIHDLNALWPRLLDTEPSLTDLPLSRVTTGTGEPLIDLSQVSPELNRAADGADMVILEGMGRGVESNLHARFRCDALNIAMIKDSLVADRVAGKVFDLVCRFRRA